MHTHSIPRSFRSPRITRTVDLTLRQRILWHLVRRYSRAELPRFGRLLEHFGIADQPAWASAPVVETRDRFHRHRLRLNLSDFFQRINYFIGAWHELDVLAALDHALRPGDAFLDGGANIGLVTLHAAGIVGPQGRVDSFECNPRVLSQLRWHQETNHLDQVLIHEQALGAGPDTARLRMPGFDNAAAATLSPIPERYGPACVELGQTTVVPADDVLDPADTRPLLIKLDVEGYELKALRGMIRTLHTRRPAIITELNYELLPLCGDSPGAIFDFLRGFGYEVFALDRAGFRGRHRLRLHPLAREDLAHEKDVIWLLPGNAHWRRFERTMQARGSRGRCA